MKRLVPILVLAGLTFLSFCVAITLSPFEPGPVAFFWGVFDGAGAPIILIASLFFGGRVYNDYLGDAYNFGFVIGLGFWVAGIYAILRRS